MNIDILEYIHYHGCILGIEVREMGMDHCNVCTAVMATLEDERLLLVEEDHTDAEILEALSELIHIEPGYII